MRVLIYFAVHKRLEVLKVCLQGIERLKNYKPEIFQVSSLAVCSSREEANILKQAGYDVVIYPNRPLGKKKNKGLQWCMKKEFDYLMEIGSDDLIHESLLDTYLPLMQAKTPVFGVNQCTFFETATGKIAEWQNDFVIGAGRMFSRELLEEVGDLWDNDRVRSLDCNSMLKLKDKGIDCKIIPSEAWQVLDIKTGENLNGFEWFESMTVKKESLDYYPYEKEMIKRLK